MAGGSVDRSVVIRLRAEMDDFHREMKKAQAELDAFKGRGKPTKAEWNSALKDIGGTFGKVGLAAGAAGAVSVRAFANFDEAMSHVAATGEDAKRSMVGLRDAALEAGERTSFSATEAAGAVEELLKAGVSAKDVMAGGLDAALDLAAAGSLNVGEAAEYAATAMNLFGISGGEVSTVADALAAGAGKAMGEVSDLGQALKQSGLVASQMGLSMTETVGSLSAFAQAGLLGSDAGTSLRTMLLRLSNPSKESATLMKKLGVAAYDAKGNFVGVAEVAGQLQKAFKGKTQAERDAAMATIFGSDAIRAANVLYSEGQVGVEKWTKAVADSGYAQDVAATKLDNLKGDWEALTGALETSFITTASGTDGPLRDLVQQLTGVTDAYNDLPQSIKDVTMGTVGMTAAIGGGTWALSKAITSYSNMRSNLSTLGGSFETTGKKAMLMRTGALAAGVGLMSLSDDIGKVDREAGIATNALGGMAAGFAVGGPWGAAIGGAIGLVKGFGDAHAVTNAEIQRMIGLYDQATGKMTAAARKSAIDELNKPLKPGLLGTGFGKVDMTALEAAKAMSIDLKTLTDAAMGSGPALQEAYTRINEIRSMDWEDFKKAAREAGVEWKDLSDAEALLGEYLDKNSDKWKTAGDRARDAAIATSGQIKTTKEFSKALEGVPMGVETELKLLGYEPTTLQLDDIIRRYNLTPEEVQTVLAALDRATPLADKVKDKADELDSADPTVDVYAQDHTGGTFAGIFTAMHRLSDGVTVPIKVSMPGQIPSLNDIYARTDANGGLYEGNVRQFAAGGFDEYGRSVPRTPQMRNSGQGAVLWGEAETGWEAYISGKPGMEERNRGILALAAQKLGGTVAFADGGFTEALSAREYASLRAREKDLMRALREKEKYGKDNKKTRLALRGWDRRETAAELREVRAEIKEQNQVRRQIGKGKKYKTAGQYNRAMKRREDKADEAEKAREDAAKAAEDATENRRSVASSFADGLGADAFKSPASLDRALRDLERDNTEYVDLLGKLKDAGASPWLLEQIRTKAGPSRTTNRTLRALLGDSARLAKFNSYGAGIVSSANNFAALTTGPGFTASYSGSALGFDIGKLIADAVGAGMARAQVNVNAQLAVSGRQAGTLVQAGQNFAGGH